MELDRELGLIAPEAGGTLGALAGIARRALEGLAPLRARVASELPERLMNRPIAPAPPGPRDAFAVVELPDGRRTIQRVTLPEASPPGGSS